MNSTFCPYSNPASTLHDDDGSSVFGGLSTSNDIESFLSWDLDTESTSNTYDFYSTSSLTSSLPIPGPASMVPATNVWGHAATLSAGPGGGYHATRKTLQCPTCESAITCNFPGQTLHGHIVSCFLERNRDQWSAAEQHADQGEGNLSQVQRTISQLDLNTRMNLMQSLYRLSKFQDPAKLAYSQHAGTELDDPILKLIYTKKTTDGEPGAV